MQGTTLFSLTLLLGGLFLASAYDVRTREVPDTVWRVLGLAGGATIAIALYQPNTFVPLVAWLVVAAFAFQHFFPWTDLLPSGSERFTSIAEVVIALGAVASTTGLAILYGVGPTGVPIAVIAALVVTVFARALFESVSWIGGADAKALMAMAMALPIYATPAALFGSGSFLQVVPFPLNALTNTALLTLLIPVYLALRNASSHEFKWSTGFTSFSLEVSLLPSRYVWVDDPALPPRTSSVQSESAAEDRARRDRQSRELRTLGIERVRVTPQLPFVFLLALGAVLTLLAGNLLWDLAISL